AGLVVGRLFGLHTAPVTGAWVAERIAWLPVFAVALAALWLVFRHAERAPRRLAARNGHGSMVPGTVPGGPAGGSAPGRHGPPGREAPPASACSAVWPWRAAPGRSAHSSSTPAFVRRTG